MTSSKQVHPYGSATDLPSVKEMEQQIRALKLWRLLMTKEQRAELKEIQREYRRISGIVDKFYELLGERNWVFTDDLKTLAMEEIAGVEDPAAAESLLLAYYKSENRIEFQLGRLRRFEPMRPRMSLLQRALNDYQEGRYYSTVLVLLSVMDGFVNDFDRAVRRGLHARSEEEMVPWDSVAGHHLGLSHAHRTFRKGFHKTDESKVLDLYRHGIIHGMLVNFDNEVVATKAWNRLFAVADWADSEERKARPVEPTLTLGEAFAQMQETRAHMAKLDEWESYEYEVDPSSTSRPDVVIACTDFLGKWEQRQWGLVGHYFMQFGGKRPSARQLGSEAKGLYSEFKLADWTLLRVRHTAAAVAHADVELLVNGAKYRTDMRWVHVDESGTVASDWQDGHWVLSPYGPSHFVKAERLDVVVGETCP